MHPLVQLERRDFLLSAYKCSHPLAVFDIPLLFETGAEKQVMTLLQPESCTYSR